MRAYAVEANAVGQMSHLAFSYLVEGELDSALVFSRLRQSPPRERRAHRFSVARIRRNSERHDGITTSSIPVASGWIIRNCFPSGVTSKSSS